MDFRSIGETVELQLGRPPGSVTSDHRTDEKPGSLLAASPFLGTSPPEELIKKSEMASLKGEAQVYGGG